MATDQRTRRLDTTDDAEFAAAMTRLQDNKDFQRFTRWIEVLVEQRQQQAPRLMITPEDHAKHNWSCGYYEALRHVLTAQNLVAQRLRAQADDPNAAKRKSTRQRD